MPSTEMQESPVCVDARDEPPLNFSLTGEAIKSVPKPQPVLQPPSCAIYAKRPHSSLWRYLVAAIILIVVGMFMGYGGTWISYMGLTLSGFAAPLINLFWMARNDRFEHEPLALIAVTFGWGVFCGIFAALLNFLVAIPLFGSPGAAFVEEPLKLLGVYWLARHKRLSTEFNDHLDGMVYGAAAGAGFAGLENLQYIMEMIFEGGVPAVGAVAIRSATSFCHMAWSAMAGRSLGLAKAMRGRTRRRDLIPGLVIAIPLHFLWNSVNGMIALSILLPIYTIIALRLLREAKNDEMRWGYQTSAPVE